MPALQVVLFDLGGTLLHYEQPPESTFEAINGRALGAFVHAAILAGARIADPELAVSAVARLAADMDAKAARAQHASNAATIIREGLEAVDVVLASGAWQAALAAYYASIAEGVRPVAGDARAVLLELAAQGRSLGLVCNTVWAPEAHDADLQRFRLLDLLPVRLYSSAVGVVKPHPAIYRQALDLFDVAPAEAVFVGDRLLQDVAGPQKIGMRAVLVASPYRAEVDPEIQPDARIGTLAELPALLAAWDRAIETRLPVAGATADDSDDGLR